MTRFKCTDLKFMDRNLFSFAFMPQNSLTNWLTEEVQSFIREHRDDNPNELLLKYKQVDNVPISKVVAQISGRKKALSKLPAWSKNPHVIYPPSVNLEQSSSEATALFKLDILRKEFSETSASNVVDLTGGFGSDTYAFQKLFDIVEFIEPDDELLETVKHNFSALGINNVRFYNTTAELFLSDTSLSDISLCYVDPSRREKGGKRTLSLEDWKPNIVALQERIFELTHRLLVKCSPLIDIQMGIRQLKFVKDVYVVSVAGECKEVLFYCVRDFQSKQIIHAINLQTNDEHFLFSSDEERQATVEIDEPKKYLYEPNASILKAGAFKIVAEKFRIKKLHPSSHFYTSDNYIREFPGRIFLIEQEVKSDRNEILKFFPEGRANVIVRNYPLTVVELRKKLKLKEGGEGFLIATTGPKKKHLLVCTKLDSL